MSNCFCILPAPDSHIEFIHQYPQSLSAYLEGEQPDIQQPAPKPTLWQRLTGQSAEAPAPVETPDDWPASECILVGEVINHRNVDLFHRILNGTDEFVTGAGSLFQTWLEAGDTCRHTAIDLTHGNEDFALMSSQVGDLTQLLSKVSLDDVRDGFTHWLRQQGETYDVSDAECVDILEEFQRFAETAAEAVRQSHGLMVISS